MRSLGSNYANKSFERKKERKRGRERNKKTISLISLRLKTHLVEPLAVFQLKNYSHYKTLPSLFLYFLKVSKYAQVHEISI